MVVMDDLLPPNDWTLGRIIKIHVGSDSYRPIVKLCHLPHITDTN